MEVDPAQRKFLHVPLFKRLLRYWVVAWLIATAMMLFTGWQTHLQVLLRGEDLPYLASALWSGVIWYVWAMLAPFAAMLAMRRPVEKGSHLVQSLALQVVIGASFISLHAAIAAWIMHWYPEVFGISSDVRSAFLQLLAMQGHWGVMSYVALIAIVHVIIYFRRAQSEALAHEELRTKAASAQLMALAQQMQPHFLFNALNALVAMQPEGSVAQIFTIRLADMLRILLHGGDRATATLGEELDLVDAYLQIERARLGTRLRTDIDVAPALIRCRLPAFILQPLVENAITHGVARTTNGGEIRLRAWRDADAVVIDVSNSCDAALADPKPADGSQLTIPNCRRRLALLYGPGARFEAGFVTRNLFRASIILPSDAIAGLQPA